MCTYRCTPVTGTMLLLGGHRAVDEATAWDMVDRLSKEYPVEEHVMSTERVVSM
jgi:hypothetical protein